MNAIIQQLDALAGVACPCGTAKRAFAGVPDAPASVHLVEVRQDAQVHWHQEHTEIYVVLDCGADAAIELDGERHPLAPMRAVMIPPGTRHRAVGRMRILNIVMPPFDAADEHF